VTGVPDLAGYPVPILTWKINAMRGRLHLRLRDGSAAGAFAKASTIVQMIASNVEDEKLRTSFLAAPAVQEVSSGGKRSIPDRERDAEGSSIQSHTEPASLGGKKIPDSIEIACEKAFFVRLASEESVRRETPVLQRAYAHVKIKSRPLERYSRR
jgi:hypothetical protein